MPLTHQAKTTVPSTRTSNARRLTCRRMLTSIGFTLMVAVPPAVGQTAAATKAQTDTHAASKTSVENPQHGNSLKQYEPITAIFRNPSNIHLILIQIETTELMKFAESLKQPLRPTSLQGSVINATRTQGDHFLRSATAKRWTESARTKLENDAIWSTFRPARIPGQTRWNVRQPRVTIEAAAVNSSDSCGYDVHVQIDGRADEFKKHVVTSPSSPTTLLVVQGGNKRSMVVAIVPAKNLSQEIATAKPGNGTSKRTILPTPAPKSVENSATTPVDSYLIKAAIFEMQPTTFDAFSKALSIPRSHGPVAPVAISRTDIKNIQMFCDENSNNDGVTQISSPFMLGKAGIPMSINVGSEAPVLVPAGSGATAVELQPVGIFLKATMKPFRQGETIMEWQLQQSNGSGLFNPAHPIKTAAMKGTSTVGDEDALVIVMRTAKQDGAKWVVAVLDISKAAAESVSTDTIEPLVRGESVLTIPLQDATELVAIAGETRIVTADKLIKTALGFDEQMVGVGSVSDHPSSIRLRMKNEGVTTVTLVDDDDVHHEIQLTIKGDDHGLAAYLRRLYPSLPLKVWPIKGSVLLRGKVIDEAQRGQVIEVARQFFPTVLDQLTINPAVVDSQQATLEQPRNAQPPSDDAVVIDGTVKQTVFLRRKHSQAIKCPARIRSVAGFDVKLLKVEPVPGDATAITVIAVNEGNSNLTLLCEDKKTYRLQLIVEHDVRSLSHTAHALYPKLNLEFIPLAGSVVVRGTVSNVEQTQQIVQLAEQYYPNVLNHLVVGSTNAASKTTKTATPVRPASFPGEPNADVNAIRKDIKALHHDVRDLIELLKDRKRAKVNTGSHDRT